MKLFFLGALFCISLSVAAQDNSRVEQYCRMIATGRLLSNKVTIDVEFGEERKLFAGDQRLRDETTGKLRKFNSVTDAMNFLGAQGWTLVNAFPMSDGASNVYHFYFKKLFKREELSN